MAQKKKNDENVFFKHKGPDKKVAIKMALEKCYKLFMYMMDKNGKLLSILHNYNCYLSSYAHVLLMFNPLKSYNFTQLNTTKSQISLLSESELR